MAIIGIFAAALTAIVGFEFRRIPGHRRILRGSAATLVGVALLLLTHSPGNEARLNVLTPGAPASARTRDAVSLDRFASPALLWVATARGRALHLTGWGLLPHEWPESLTAQVTLAAAPLPHGVIALDLPAEIGLGERLVVSGQLNLGRGESVWVCLDDPAGARDSVRVDGASPTFRLSDWPRAATRVEYRLRVRQGATLLAHDTIGVAVRTTRPPTVLILDASPSFESTYLKRWLAERGGSVTVRTRLSRDRYRTERINKAGTPIDRLTTATLAGYDAVLADGTALAALAPAEQAALRQAVQEEGLGLLITGDAGAGSTSDLARGMVTAAPMVAEEWSVRPIWPEAPRRSPVVILAEAAELSPASQRLVGDAQGRSLAAQRAAGEGRIGITLLRTPSRWLLEGEPDLFASYWQLLLTAVARDTGTRVAVSAEGPPRAEQPVTLSLTIPRVAAGVAAQWPRVTVTAPDLGVDTIAFVRDPFDPRQWSGRYWPRAAGWHTLALEGGRTVPFRVTHEGEWIGLEAAARRLASSARLGTAASGAAPPVATFWWRLGLFAMLLALLTWLWIEPRLDG